MPKTFGMSFYGYNKNEVNEFISNVTNEYESMLDKLKQTNEEMKKSIMDEATKKFGSELPDEMLDVVNGGRDITYDEEFEVSMKTYLAIDAARNGRISQEELTDFMNKVMEYRKYIQSLPDDAPPQNFGVFDFMDSNNELK